MNKYELIKEAVQYGFKYALESQNDGKSVPQGNIDQWLMGKFEFIFLEDLEEFKKESL